MTHGPTHIKNQKFLDTVALRKDKRGNSGSIEP